MLGIKSAISGLTLSNRSCCFQVGFFSEQSWSTGHINSFELFHTPHTLNHLKPTHHAATIDHDSSFGALTLYHTNGVVRHTCKACEINTCVLEKSFSAQAHGHFGNTATFFLLINYHPVEHLLNDHPAAPFWPKKVGLPFFLSENTTFRRLRKHFALSGFIIYSVVISWGSWVIDLQLKSYPETLICCFFTFHAQCLIWFQMVYVTTVPLKRMERVQFTPCKKLAPCHWKNRQN